jgi:type II secretory ATPase GspE/PulE/Tfp pilus assembly ATPase PilB-like protein
MDAITKQLVGFWRKFSKMVGSGIPVLQTLRVIRDETSDKDLAEAIESIRAGIESGQAMSAIVEKYPAYFPPSVQTMVKAGETTGRLDSVCAEIAAGMEDGTFPIERVADDGTAPASVAAEKVDPVPVRLVNDILVKASENRASDIHIEWKTREELRVRYRVDGVLSEELAPEIPVEARNAVISRVKLMAGLDVAERRLPQDGRIVATINEKSVNFRVSVVPYATGESAVIRVLYRDHALPSLEQQDFSEAQLKQVRGWCGKPNGIIVVTGPTGCGKTTTLYGLLAELNTPDRKIVTVEDPVEYLIEGVNQQQIRPHIGLTIPAAIRSELRQAPNIMMVGEIRDLETANLVIQTALTGHLVLTSLHANSAAGALIRLLDIGVAPFLVADTVIGVMTQRLLRKTCEHCREEYDPEEWLRDALKEYKVEKPARGKGCEHCHAGYRGRTAVHELLELDENIRKLVVTDPSTEDIRDQAVQSGMTPLFEDSIAKVNAGTTTIEEVLRVCGACR